MPRPTPAQDRQSRAQPPLSAPPPSKGKSRAPASGSSNPVLSSSVPIPTPPTDPGKPESFEDRDRKEYAARVLDSWEMLARFGISRGEVGFFRFSSFPSPLPFPLPTSTLPPAKTLFSFFFFLTKKRVYRKRDSGSKRSSPASPTKTIAPTRTNGRMKMRSSGRRRWSRRRQWSRGPAPRQGQLLREWEWEWERGERWRRGVGVGRRMRRRRRGWLGCRGVGVRVGGRGGGGNGRVFFWRR